MKLNRPRIIQQHVFALCIYIYIYVNIAYKLWSSDDYRGQLDKKNRWRLDSNTHETKLPIFMPVPCLLFYLDF